jgi:hypothetical protein
LHESLGPAGALDLPEYQGALAPAGGAIVTDARPRPASLGIRKLSPAQSKKSRRVAPAQWLGTVRLVAAVVLISAVGTLLFGLANSGDNRGNSKTIAAAGQANPARRPIDLNERGLVTLASLNLPGSCFPRAALVAADAGQSPPAAVAAAAKEHLQCCTLCHRAEQAKRPNELLVAKMSQSCTACHQL